MAAAKKRKCCLNVECDVKTELIKAEEFDANFYSVSVKDDEKLYICGKCREKPQTVLAEMAEDIKSGISAFPQFPFPQFKQVLDLDDDDDDKNNEAPM